MDDYFEVDSKECVQCGACIFACVYYGFDILFMTRHRPYDDGCDVLPCRHCEMPCYTICPNMAISIERW